MKYLITFSYDGSKFYGYQKQPDKETVQDNIESALTLINSNNSVSISASGRTDSGVHALNQKAHFYLNKDLECEDLKYSLNKMISKYIYIKNIVKIDDDFHARFNVVSKKYSYKINIGEYNPLECDYIYQYNKNINTEKMKIAIKKLIGKHNFKSFTKSNKDITDYERTIFNAYICLENNIITITFIGSGFMRYMVRNLVGLLIEIGEEKKDINSVNKILEFKDRTKAGITAPACGLYLMEVNYE